MIIVIDAINLKQGGGLTHLVNILKYTQPVTMGFSKIIVLGCKKTLDEINSRPHIIKIHSRYFESNYIFRAFWLYFKLDRLLKKLGANILFVPGGGIYSSFRPVVTMSRNSLPLEMNEARRYGLSLVFLDYLFYN